jgi:hypothetical protein
MMKRESMRSWLCAISSGLLMAACGAPEEGVPAAEEPLGTRQSALCAGLSVTALNLNGMSSYGGVLAGNGGWAVSAGANAVYLEYRVDGSLRSYEVRTGSSGTWYLSSSGIACGAHSVEVKAFPMVIDSANNQTTCTEAPRSFTQSVTQACPTATLSCTRPSNTVNCTGTGSAGTGGYTAFWRMDEESDSGTYNGPWYQSANAQNFYCPIKHGSVVWNGQIRVEFKVRDNSGMESAVTSRTYLCAFD